MNEMGDIEFLKCCQQSPAAKNTAIVHVAFLSNVM